eukprot:1181222-Prorocentrum_minimum.AAC.2
MLAAFGLEHSGRLSPLRQPWFDAEDRPEGGGRPPSPPQVWLLLLRGSGGGQEGVRRRSGGGQEAVIKALLRVTRGNLASDRKRFLVSWSHRDSERPLQ